MNEIPDVAAGYLIVKSFERMYREFDQPAQPGELAPYSMPRVGILPGAIAKQYRGISRDALESWTGEELEHGYPNIPTPTERAASMAMAELEAAGREAEDFIFSLEDAERVFGLLQEPNEWELIWACRSDRRVERPPRTSLLGHEPTWWTGDHFSAVMDSMCFPRWHGPDPDGTLLVQFHERLNANGLFPSASDAEEFLTFYRSQSWAETGTYAIAEVRGVSQIG